MPCVTRDTSHRRVFTVEGTAGEVPLKVQALSEDIPGSGGHSFPSSRVKTRNVPPGGVSPAHALTIVVLFLAVVLSGCAGSPVSHSVPAVAVWDRRTSLPAPRESRGSGRCWRSGSSRRSAPVAFRSSSARSSLLAVEEMRLGSSALADESTRLRLGKITGARQMVFGGYLTVGNRVRIDLRLVDVETGKVLRTASRTGPRGRDRALLDLCGKAADDLFP